MRRDERRRVLGPYDYKTRWVIIVVDPSRAGGSGTASARMPREFKTEAKARAAKKVIEDNWSRLETTTVSEAIDMYLEYLTAKGTGEISRTETVRRLRAFFTAPDRCIGDLEAEECADLYRAYQAGRAVSTHRQTLIEARSFLRWGVRQKWLRENPLADVEGVGKRNTGKMQLTGDESRKFYEWCMWRANRGDDAALAVLALLMMALRQGDLIRRVVRDVDQGATVLRVEGGKTKKSNRPRKIPAVLQPLFRQLADKRMPLEPLFKTPEGGHHTKSWLRKAMLRFTRDAGVPYVCPHSLKGTAASVLADAGELADKIAEHLSHEQSSTTMRHYAAPGALESAQVARGLAVIQGGVR